LSRGYHGCGSSDLYGCGSSDLYGCGSSDLYGCGSSDLYGCGDESLGRGLPGTRPLQCGRFGEPAGDQPIGSGADPLAR
jgi:hypothetical protein